MLDKLKQYVMSCILIVIDVTLVSASIDFGVRRSALMVGLAIVIAIGSNEIISRISKERASELAVISIIPAMFLLSSLLFNTANINSSLHTEVKIAGILFVSMNAIAQYVLKLCILHKSDIESERMGDWFRKHRWILIVMLSMSIIRIPFMNLLQRWDSGEYYYRFAWAVRDFTYTSFYEYYQTYLLCNHPTMAFSLVYAIGEMALPSKIMGVMIVNMVITLFALWCIYQIIMKLFRDMTEIRAALYTLIISVLPLFLGTFGYFNLDYALAIFFVYAIYAFVYHRYIMLLWAGILCVQTKETGLVLVVGLLCGSLFVHLMKSRKWTVIVDIFQDIRTYAMMIAIGVQIYYMNYIGGVSKWHQTPDEDTTLRWNNSGYNCLGFQPHYIITKLKQQYILNFNWIFTVLMITGAAILLYRYMKTKKREASWDLVAIAVSLCAFTSFSCLYVTASMARYNVSGDIMLALLALYMLDIIVKKKIRIIAISVMTVLLVIETYLTIDPFTKLVFMKIDTGACDMVYIGDTSDGDLYYGDDLVYNSQYSYIDKAFDYILKEVGYSQDMDVVVFNCLDDTKGIHVAGNTPLYWVFWDNELGKRTFVDWENEDIDVIYSNDIKDGKIEEGEFVKNYEALEPEFDDGEEIDDVDEYRWPHPLKDRVVAVVIPYYHVDEEAAIANMSEYYMVTEKRQYTSIQGTVTYYIFDKK